MRGECCQQGAAASSRLPVFTLASREEKQEDGDLDDLERRFNARLGDLEAKVAKRVN